MDEAFPPQEIVRVFLLDDLDVVRQGLRELLESDGGAEVVGETGSAQAAVDLIVSLEPDVAIIDATLPDGSGIAVCRAVRARAPRVAVLIVTPYDDDEGLLSAFMAGAAGYLLEQIRGHRLVESVHEAARGWSMFGDDAADRRQNLLRPPGGACDDAWMLPLSPQQRGVLECITEGMTQREVSAAMFIAEKTVQTLITGLVTELGLGGSREIATEGAAGRSSDRR